MTPVPVRAAFSMKRVSAPTTTVLGPSSSGGDAASSSVAPSWAWIPTALRVIHEPKIVAELAENASPIPTLLRSSVFSIAMPPVFSPRKP